MLRGVSWCIVVKRQSDAAADPGIVRLSVTIPADDYADIKRAAERKRVSIAWIVRDALSQYLREQAPLFRS